MDGDDEIEGDAESDQEMAAGLRAVQQARLWTPGCEIASAVPNGLNGYRELISDNKSCAYELTLQARRSWSIAIALDTPGRDTHWRAWSLKESQ